MMALAITWKPEEGKPSKFLSLLIWLFVLFALLFGCTSSWSAEPGLKLPGQAPQLLPILKQEIQRNWKSIPIPEAPAGLIEQESGWKPSAVLKTKREFGCGLGQFTMTYKADGSVRFDTISDMKKLDKTLNTWTWADCANVQLQLRAVVIKMRTDSRTCLTGMANEREAMGCTAAKYNGGPGSIVNRVRLCRLQAGCNPALWFDNLQKQCPMSNKKVEGYGESFCDINSKYPGRVFARMVKYKDMMKI